MTYAILKSVHVISAGVTFAGFIVRGYWMMTKSPLLQLKLTRILPHIVDTVFLASGIWLLFVLHLNALSQPWLLAKFTGLVVYVLLGTIALKRGSTRKARTIAFIASIVAFIYIVGIAFTKTPLGWLG